MKEIIIFTTKTSFLQTLKQTGLEEKSVHII